MLRRIISSTTVLMESRQSHHPQHKYPTADLYLSALRFFCAQACKLGCLLKEAERRREDLQGELSSQVLEVERSKADMEELLQHNARLQQDSEEHQALKGAYNALLNRSEADRPVG